MGTMLDRFTAARRPPRWLQFRLRTVLVVMTLACIASAAYGWHWRHSRRLEVMVERFNDSLDAGQYDEAERIAVEVLDLYPQEHVAVSMREKIRIVRYLLALDAGELTVECCGTGGFRCVDRQ